MSGVRFPEGFRLERLRSEHPRKRFRCSELPVDDWLATKAGELGGRVLAGPFDAPWVRMAVIADPQGATFIASQFVPENRGAPAADTSGAA